MKKKSKLEKSRFYALSINYKSNLQNNLTKAQVCQKLLKNTLRNEANVTFSNLNID